VPTTTRYPSLPCFAEGRDSCDTLNWEKYSLRCVRLRLWHNVLWVHIQGVGGYFISYRKLEQWIAACSTVIRFCPNLQSLNTLWESILQEAYRYTEEAFSRLDVIFQQRLSVFNH